MHNLVLVNDFIKALKSQKIAVLGDLICDRYISGPVSRISPEAPVQILDAEGEQVMAGGAANAAKNLVPFGVETYILGCLGNDPAGDTTLATIRDDGPDTAGVSQFDDISTPLKTRILSQNQQLIRIDQEKGHELPEHCLNLIMEKAEKILPGVDGLILSDYGKGLLSDRIISFAVKKAKEINIPVVVDPKGKDYYKYKGVTALTPNRREAEEASLLPCRTDEELESAAAKLSEITGARYVLITLGADGMFLFEEGAENCRLRALKREVYDVTGAGDTVTALFGAGLFAGFGAEESASFANIAAGIVVGKLGSAVADPTEVQSAVSPYTYRGERKIKNIRSIKDTVKNLKADNRRIVFTNGCFDLMHIGHIKYLAGAREQGDTLIVGINSDTSVKKIKGDERPLIGEKERSRILAALECVDYVVIFEEETPLELIKQVEPDIMVKGGDYEPEEVVGKDEVEARGGEVRIIPFVEGISTTEIIEAVKKKFK